MKIIAIDSNVLIAALIRNGISRELLTNLKVNFVYPEEGIAEIYKYKEEIKEKASIESEKDFHILLFRLLKYIRLVPVDFLKQFRYEADKIIGHIHKSDTVFIATALAFNCPVWSDDKHFKKQSKVKILTTKELVDLTT